MGVKSGDKVNLVSFASSYLPQESLMHSSSLCDSEFVSLIFQVLLPEYGGMQVKIDDKELFMFRSAFVP